MKPNVLVVDDERAFRVLAEEALTSEGFEVRSSANLSKARSEIERAVPDVVVLDRRLPDGDSMEFLRQVHADNPAILFVVATAYGDVANAVEAVRAGAADYLIKPIQPTDLLMKLRKALELRGLRDRLALSKESNARAYVEPTSKSMRAVTETLRSVSQSPMTSVLLAGASGSGKQYAAELLHALTHPPAGSEAPFVDVNCATLGSNLVESELFGHERGAFTDAKTSRRGLIEMAEGGTLFLDEIAELPESSQAKLLKFLDTMRFRRLGGEREIEVKLRVVAATNHDIDKLVQSGRFRADLYHRLAVILVRVPPLSERREEIPDLARAFVKLFATRIKKGVSGLSDGALAKLSEYDFPGNVRELRNIIERSLILSHGPSISERDIVLPTHAPEHRRTSAFFEVNQADDGALPSLHQIERAYILRMLEHAGGRRVATAQALGISYPTLLKHLRELGIAEE